MSMISDLVEELIDNADLYTKELHDLMYRAAYTIETMSEKAKESKQEWIPCNERLPEEIGRYLCTVGAPYRNPREMYYAPQEWADKSDRATWRSIDGNYVFDWFVEAWMPLPPAYEGADDGEMA
jgi:hypothetical protein